MIQVDNKKTIAMLAKRFMKQNRRRNIILIIAIALTTMMFTAVFAGVISMYETKQAQEIRNSMMSAHASVQEVSDEQCDELLKILDARDDVVRIGIGRFLGLAVNNELIYQTELRSADENLAESFNCLPTTGTMPTSKDEIACSSLVLDCLGVKKQIGEEITLKIWTDDQTVEKTFRLSGFWKGDKTVMAQLIWCDTSLVEELCGKNYDIKRLSSGEVCGSYEMSIWFDNTWNLEKKVDEIATQVGNYGDRLIANMAYEMFGEGGLSVGALLLFVGIIFLAGYLIIYNVFYISIKNDIKTFGLLKNIGVTGKQMRKIIYRQAAYLCGVSIPVGIVVGYIASYGILPLLMADLDNIGETLLVHSTNPFIFVLAALLSGITVFISCMRPCMVVKKLMPVEAIRYADQIPNFRVHKKKKKVSPIGMAFSNMRKSWKKGIIIMTSMALSMIVLNSVVMLVQGISFKQYVEIFISSDMKICKTILDSNMLENISNDQLEEIAKCKDIENFSICYMDHSENPLSEEVKDILDRVQINLDEFFMSQGADETEEFYNDAYTNETMDITVVGINEAMFQRMVWADGRKPDWSQFNQEGKAVINMVAGGNAPGVSFLYDGEQMTVPFRNGNEEVMTIVGEGELAFDLQYPIYQYVPITIYISEDNFLRLSDSKKAYECCMEVVDGKEIEAEKYMEEHLLMQDETLEMRTMQMYEKEFQSMLKKYVLIGGMIVMVFAVIGIMNYFNTTMMSMISRKKELSLLEAVGMTKKQILKMLVTEGIVYLMGSIFVAILVTVFAVTALMDDTLGMAFFIQIHVNVIPSLCLIPILLILAIAVPAYCYKKIEKESLVERIRNE